MLAWRGAAGARPEPWIQRAERTVRPEAEPTAGLLVCYGRGLLELARGHCADALTAFRAAEPLAGLLAAPQLLLRRVQALRLQAMVRLGETERAERALAELDEQERERGQIRIATAVLRLAQDHPRAAINALGPVLDGSAPVTRSTWLAQAFMLEATARNALGDPAAAGRALERALDLAEPDSTLSAFLIHPVPALLKRYARHSTRHAALISEILDLLPQPQPRGPGGPRGVWAGSPPGPGGSGGVVPPISRAPPANRAAQPGRDPRARLCRPTCPRRRSPASCPCQCTRSGRTYATSLPSSACTVAPRRSRVPAPSPCSLHPAARPEVSCRLPGPAEYEKGSAGHQTYCSADDSAAAKAGCRCRSSIRTYARFSRAC